MMVLWTFQKHNRYFRSAFNCLCVYSKIVELVSKYCYSVSSSNWAQLYLELNLYSDLSVVFLQLLQKFHSMHSLGFQPLHCSFYYNIIYGQGLEQMISHFRH